MRWNPGLRQTTLDDGITRFALLIASLDGGHGEALGSGVFIAPELALTAKHVIENVRGTVMGLQFRGSAEALAVWKSWKAWACPWSDLALIHFIPHNDLAKAETWGRTIGVSGRPPEVGDEIGAFGYAKSQIHLNVQGDMTTIDWTTGPCNSIGVVEEVHQEFRDSVLQPNPCFLVNTPFPAGMSGGPVIGICGPTAGRLCGVVSSDLGGHDVQATAYAVTFWPVLGMQIDFEGPGLTCRGLYPLIELPSLHVFDFDAIKDRVEETTDQGRRRLRLRPQ